MATEFKLYDQLASSSADILIDNKVICRTITNLDINHAEIIYALILHHYISTTGNIPSTPPYNGSVFPGGKGIKILWTNLPSDLQRIVAHYIDSNKCK